LFLPFYYILLLLVLVVVEHTSLQPCLTI
jgi:hypothetical protein